MNLGERCMYEDIAQGMADGNSVSQPVQCPVREECFGRPNHSKLICLRVLRGESTNEVVDNLVKSAMESETVVKALFEKRDNGTSEAH